jgi:hypothetical protein
MLMMTTCLIWQEQAESQTQEGVEKASAGAGRPVGTGVKVAAAAGSWVATVTVGDGVGITKVGCGVGGTSARVAVGRLRGDATGGGVEGMGVGADNPKIPVHPANESTR